MLAFSAVTQFPTNGSSTRTAGEGVQASTSAEHVMSVKKRKIRIVSRELCTTRTFLARYARRCSRQDEGCVRLPKVPPAREFTVMVKPVCHRVENYT
jgi:hypothetical protein